MHVQINLLTLMAQKNITPKQMSEGTGLTAHTINSLMNNQKSQLHFETIASICNQLNCEIGDLLTLKKEVSK